MPKSAKSKSARARARARNAAAVPGDACCWVCQEGPSELEDPGPLSHGGCACRGTAGFVHFKCLLQAAAADEGTWGECPTCRTGWSGDIKLRLTRAHGSKLKGRAAGDRERLVAGLDLVAALGENGHLGEAIDMARDNLAIARKSLAPDDLVAHQTAAALATVQLRMQDYLSAAVLFEEMLPVMRRRCVGDLQEMFLQSLLKSAAALQELGDARSAVSCCEETIRRCKALGPPGAVLGRAAVETLAGVHRSTGDYDLALPLMKQVMKGNRQVFGPAHPTTLVSIGNLGTLLSTMGEMTAADPLLRSASDGLGAALGAEHPNARHFCSCVFDNSVSSKDLRVHTWAAKQAAARRVVLCDVVGLKARADLNSCRARILCYLPDKQRYTVQLLSARVFGTKINIKPANLRIDEGSGVVIVGVPEVEGLSAVVLAYDVAESLYRVRISPDAVPATAGEARSLTAEQCRADVDPAAAAAAVSSAAAMVARAAAAPRSRPPS